MNIRYLFLSVLLLGCNAFAQNSFFGREQALKLEYDADFQYLFDNREFEASGGDWQESHTIHAARLTPSVGLSIQQSRQVKHTLMLGVDIMRNMGEYDIDDPAMSNLKLFREMTLYYKGNVRMRKGVFEGYAGMFPRTSVEGEYSHAFWSDSTLFVDNKLEGMLLKYRSRRFYSEIGCDWMGKHGQTRRERFQVFSAGSWSAADGLSLGWAASLYHFAGSETLPSGSVVDNAMLNPWIRYDAARLTGLDELSLKAGAIATYQRDRRASRTPSFPLGAELVLTSRWRSLGIENVLYAGDNLQPLFARYGNALYFGSPFYAFDLYDRCEAFWAPRIADYLSLKVSAVFHFGSGFPFLGSQQKVGLVFDLDAFRHPAQPLPGERRRRQPDIRELFIM